MEYNIANLDCIQKNIFFKQLANQNKEKVARLTLSGLHSDRLEISKIINSKKDIDWRDSDSYHKQIEALDISSIVNTPFMLQIISETLPELLYSEDSKTSTKITRAKLYEVFTDSHF